MSGRYRATLRVNGKQITLGYFRTEKERQAAHAAAWAEKYPYGKCSKCDTPANEDGEDCERHRVRPIVVRADGSDGDVFDSECVTQDEWNRLRGYDPVTRTYSDTPTPAARLDQGWTD